MIKRKRQLTQTLMHLIAEAVKPMDFVISILAERIARVGFGIYQPELSVYSRVMEFHNSKVLPGESFTSANFHLPKSQHEEDQLAQPHGIQTTLVLSNALLRERPGKNKMAHPHQYQSY
jgi:hypothetical protein